MNKSAIEKFAVWARRKLISEITYKANMLGITDSGIASPLPQSTADLQIFDVGTREPARVSGVAVKQRSALVQEIKRRERTSDYKTAYDAVIEEVAYTWFNRLIAIRFMEVNDYLPSRIRVLSSENPSKAEPDFVTTPFETDLSFSDIEQGLVLKYKDENRLDELFQMLFIKQCNKLNEILPELFEKTDDYTELLLTISFTDKDGVVYHLTHDISEEDFNIEMGGQVEIIGWMYQYYNSELKDETFAQLKKNVKISKERIPAATQLFTPDWIVRYMVENSLGRLWVEGHPNESLKAEWKYYLEEAEQDGCVKAELEKIRTEYRRVNPEDIKVIDPCMGSGHILVYAFDVLIQIYESCGYTQRDAAKSIVENNLFGLDIDRRAYQLSYFALMMKARQYNRRILTESIRPQVFCTAVDHEGAEYGSLLIVDELAEQPAEPQDLFELTNYEQRLATWNYRRLLHQKYDVVVTNPPYMGNSGMNSRLAQYVKDYYPDSKSDASTAFMEKTLSLCSLKGYMAMINIPVWMFLASYEKLRSNIIANNTLVNMVHPGRGIFGSDFGTTAFVIGKYGIKGYKGQYRRLFDKQGEVVSNEQREQRFHHGVGLFFACQEDFAKIPGSPIAYWASENVIKNFSQKKLGEFADARQGLITGDNDTYLRYWFEVPVDNISFDCRSCSETAQNGIRWYPYAKGGGFRRWYGFNDVVVDWENDGMALKNFRDASGKLRSRPQNLQTYFQPGLTWSALTMYKLSLRIMQYAIYGGGGAAMFASADMNRYLLGFTNSIVAEYYLNIINPTINFLINDILSLPVIVEDKVEIEGLVTECVEISKNDYDSFETSREFPRNPLVPYALYASKLEEIYTRWALECNQRRKELQCKEIALNSKFIEMYGLTSDLSASVEERDIVLHQPDMGSAVKSMISYAVGCMFGRYSLDVDGLAYAGGDWNASKYMTFFPDADNIIPICDDAYFEDDIVGRFVEFVRVVYGSETLEENLAFIASAIGNSGSSSREIIRNYFLNDFITDHIKTYQKRPIYWLFDSGKQNGFKALVYMHRWTADTTGNVRIEYLHKMQRAYERELEHLQDTIDNSTISREIAAATKRKEKISKQIKECKDYDERIAHLALARIDIDLDDGVKINYEKVQTGTDGKKLEILAKIK